MRTMNAAAPTSRLVLLAPPRDGRDPKIRRYRLARLKLTEDPRRGARGEAPFSHLKRVYD
jgi:hypothetical protein